MNQHFRFTTFFLMLLLVSSCDQQTQESIIPDSIETQSTSAAVEPSVPESNTVTVEAESNTEAVEAESDVIKLEWESLIPADWELDGLMEEYNNEDISDDDPRAAELLAKIRQLWKEAPVVESFDGKQVKLPGYMVPLEMDTESIREFLLVPYYGACIHTPPPPGNQTVHVVTDNQKPYAGKLFDTVWVTGTMKIEKHSSEIGDSGYRIDANKVEPFR